MNIQSVVFIRVLRVPVTAATHPVKGDALVHAVKARFPGASVTRCEHGKVDVDLVLGVDSFSLDKALEVEEFVL